MTTLLDFKQRYQWKTEKNGIGGGGFGSVYKAFDTLEHRYVAIKISEVKPEFGDYTLKREFELVKDLPTHRNIARYKTCNRFNTDSGIADFAVLKYYELGNLEQFLNHRAQRKNPLTHEEMYALVSGILQGICFLHQNGIIHRDIKAQNVLIEREDGVWVPKIADFGLSREHNLEMSISRGIAISYPYAAPEQLPANELVPNAPKIRANVDLWAIGVMIYRIVGGMNPFVPDSQLNMNNDAARIELVRRIWNVELPESLQYMPEPYQAMIRRCLVKDVSKRVQKAEELLLLMNQKPPFIKIGGDNPSKLPVKSLLYGGIGLLLIVGLGISWIRQPKKDTPTQTTSLVDSNANIISDVASADKQGQTMQRNRVMKDSTDRNIAMTQTAILPHSPTPITPAQPPTPVAVRTTTPKKSDLKENESPIPKNIDNGDHAVYEYESNENNIRLQNMNWGYLRNQVSCLDAGQNLGIKLIINKLGRVESAQYHAPTSNNIDVNRDRKCIDNAKTVCQNFTCKGERNGQPVRFSVILHVEKK
jgi:serine/threonine protein kinase